MKNMKRLVAVMMVLALALCFAACAAPQQGPTTAAPTTPTTTVHTHSFGSEWKSDADNHWNECACNEKGNVAAHADANIDGKCDTCAAEVALPDPSHIVVVVDQDGNPVAGVLVQLCTDGNCFNPVATDENGVAKFYMPELIGAMTKICSAAGYTYSEDYTNFPEGENTVTLVVTAIAE